MKFNKSTIKHLQDGNIIIVGLLLVIFVVFVFWIKDTLTTYYLYTRSTIPIQSRNNEINKYLDKLLTDVPDAIVTRVNLIHSVKFASTNQTPILRWDTIYARTNPEHKSGAGPLLRDQPLIAWSNYIEDLLAGHCRYMLTKNLNNDAPHQSLYSMGVYSFDVCPIVDNNKKLLGAIFLSWEENRPPINPESQFPLMLDTAKKITVVLEESTTL